MVPPPNNTTAHGLFDGMGFENHDRNTYLRSPMNYMGNKWGSLPTILKHLPHSNTFVDVCSGSGQVLLGRAKSKLEVLNDRNSGIITFYRCLQDPAKLDEVIDRVKLMPHSRELFLDCVETWESEKNETLRAAKWYYLIQCSFGGKGTYFGRVTKGSANIWNKIHDNLALFAGVHERLKGVLIENSDWRTILKDFDGPDTVFYFDPPYFDANVYFHNFTKADHFEMCNKIFDCQGFVALSGFSNYIYDQFPWHHKIKIDVKEMSHVKGHNHDPDAEIAETRQEILYIKDWDD